MRVQVICGFLGAGKTTLLKNLVRQAGSDTAILVNEFGELGIDGAIVSEGNNLNVVEMPSGCICCSLRESLVDAVREIIEKYDPRLLIIEPSGVASPSSILTGLQKADFQGRLELAPVVGIIDMTFFIEVINDGDISDMGSFFQDQVMNSDIILLNKADLADAQTLARCREAVAELNPSAVIIPTVYCRTELPEIQAKGEVVHFHYSPGFNAEVFRVEGEMDRRKVEDLLKSLNSKAFGDIFRAKGIISTAQGPVTFDYVHGQVNFGKLKKADGNKLVFIGRDLDRSKLDQAITGGVVNGPA